MHAYSAGEGDWDSAGDDSSWEAPAATTPTGVAAFAEDVAIRRYAEQSSNIVHWTDFDRGGHFPAMEVPDLLVGDIREFFRDLR
jgi:pimeloyl-ACP methyl ester carboxylesterase